jgi:arylsulfatase A-like enzyme
MIIKWPGYEGEYRDDKFHTNVDLAPTMADMLNIEPFKKWDGMSYAKTITEKKDCGYDDLVLTQCAHVCQRSARFDDYIYIRTVHGGYHLFDDEMLFNIKEDPHQTNNLAKSYPELCAKGAKIILDWEYDMMKSSSTNVDPMWTVMREGGPLHSRGELTSYVERLKQTDRGEFVEELLEKYPNERYQ